MKALWTGLGRIVTKSRGSKLCSNGGCKLPIKIKEQYWQTTRGRPPKVYTRSFHLRCVGPWLEYLAERRTHRKDITGRPILDIPIEVRGERRKLYRRVRYTIDLMKKARSLEERQTAYQTFTKAAGDVEAKTGFPWVQVDTPTRQTFFSRFMTELERLKSNVKAATPTTIEPDRTPEQNTESDRIVQEIFARVEQGYIKEEHEA